MREMLGSVNQLAVTIGIMLVYLLGIFVKWRVLTVIGVLSTKPTDLVYVSLKAKMGMMEACESSVQVLRGFETDISEELAGIRELVLSSCIKTTIDFSDFKRRRNWFPFMLGMRLLVLQQLSGINAILFYSSTILEKAGLSSGVVPTLILGTIPVIATGVASWLMDRAGRRVLLIISSSGMAASLLLVAGSFFLEGIISKDSAFYGTLGMLSLVGLVTTAVSFSLGDGPIPWLIMSEILPASIKGLAGSIATLANFLASWGITVTASQMLSWNSGGTFLIYTLFCAFTTIFVALWVPETKGRSLEEIQGSFERKKRVLV